MSEQTVTLRLVVADGGKFRADIKGGAEAVDQLGGRAQGARPALRGLSDDSERSAGAVRRLTADVQRYATAAAAALSVRGLARAADTWSDMRSLVQNAIGPHEDVANVMERLSAVARTTYSALEGTVDAYVRNAVTLRALRKTTQEQLDYTEALNNALVVSGAKGESYELVQNAMSKAMATGTLRGQELETVMFRGSRVAELLADELGVNITQLRGLAAQGRITGDVIFNALTKNLETVRREAERMPATIGDGFTLIRNAALQHIGVLDQQAMLSERLAERLVKVADNFEVVATAAGLAGIVMVSRYAGPAAAALYAKAAATVASTVALQREAAQVAALDAARVASLQADARAIASARAEAMASMASANAALARARAMRAATLATGAQAHASGMLRQAVQAETAATLQLSAAQTTLARLGQQGARVQAQLATATTAAAASKRAAGLAARAAAGGMTVLRAATAALGGPVGASIAGVSLLVWWLARLRQQAKDVDLSMPAGQMREMADAAQRAARGQFPLPDAAKDAMRAAQEQQDIYRQRLAIGAAELQRAQQTGNERLARATEARIRSTQQALDELIRDTELYRRYVTGEGTGGDMANAVNEHVAALQRQLELMREGATAAEASRRVQLEAQNMGSADIAAYLEAQAAIDALEAARRADARAAEAQRAAAHQAAEAMRETAAAARQQLRPIAAQLDELESTLAALAGTGGSADELRAYLDVFAEGAVGVDRLTAAARAYEQQMSILQTLRDGVTVGDVTVQISDQDFARFSATARAAFDEVVQGAQRVGDELARQRPAVEAYLSSSVGRDFAAGFDVASQSLGVLLGRFGELVDGQRDYAEALREAAGDTATLAALQERHQRNQIALYGDMAAAAKGFFSEGSSGYKMLTAAEQAFRAIELALAAKSLAAKLFSTQASTAAAVASVPVVVGAETAKATAAGTAAAASSMVGVPWPLNMGALAITVAALAALGVAVRSGGGGSAASGPSFAAPDMATGRGAVLGDAEAQSRSIRNALELLTDVAERDLRINVAQLENLQLIARSLTGVSNSMLRANALSTGTLTPFAIPASSTSSLGWLADGMRASSDFTARLGGLFGVFGPVSDLIEEVVGGLGGLVADMVSRAFGTRRTQVASGLAFERGQSLADALLGGVNAGYYATIKESRRVAGITTSRSYSDTVGALDDATQRQIDLVISGIADVTADAARGIGMSEAQIQAAFAGVDLGLSKINLQGLSAAEASERLEAVFAAVGDRISQHLVPDLLEYQRQGEGALETLVRLSVQMDVMRDAAATLGLQGQLTVAAVDDLADRVGGVQQLAAGVAGLFELTLTDVERLARQGEMLGDALGHVGLQLPATRDGIRDLIAGLDLTGDAGRAAFAALSGSAERMADYYSALERMERERGDALAGVEERIARLALSSEAFAALQLDREVDKLREQFRDLGLDTLIVDQLAALERSAQVREQYGVDALRSFREQLRSERDAAVGVSLDVARSQFEAVSRRARLGDVDAVRDLPRIGEQLRAASQSYAANQVDYLRDLAVIERAVTDAESVAERQADIAARQFAEIESQTDLLQGIYDEIAARRHVLLEAPVLPALPAAGSPAATGGAAVDLAALVAEVRELRDELRQVLGAAADRSARIERRVTQIADVADMWDNEGLPPEREAAA